MGMACLMFWDTHREICIIALVIACLIGLFMLLNTLCVLGVTCNDTPGSHLHIYTKENVTFSEKVMNGCDCGVTYYHVSTPTGDDYVTHNWWLYNKIQLNTPYTIKYNDVNWLRIYEVS
jgi:hypothetical protein